MSWKVLSGGGASLEVDDLIEYIKGALEYAKENSLGLDRIYDNCESCEDGKVQNTIRISTRSLILHFCAMDVLNASDAKQSDLEDALEVLDKAKGMFSNHPFSNVLYGRQVYIATKAGKAGLEMPAKFASYPQRKLFSWQNPHLNYSSPADFKQKEDIEIGLPPEWRR